MTKPRKKPTIEKPHLPGKSTTARKADGKFEKGAPKPATAGRARGKRNKTTIMLKEAILTAAELCGSDGKGRDGMVGYLRMLASKERTLFSRLLEKVLPMQLDLKDTTKKIYTPDEAAARLQERGLPVPPTLLQLTSVAHALNDLREDGETDDLDNRHFNEETGDSD
jgi:hypothetical protein